MAPTAVETNPTPSVDPAKLSNVLNGKGEHFTVESFNAKETSIEELRASLIHNGVLYFRNLLTKEDMDQITKECQQYLDDDTPWEGVCFPPQTRRISGLAFKSPTFRKKVIMNPQWLALSDSMLTLEDSAWFGDVQAKAAGRPINGGSVCFLIGPGATAQGLHRDNMIYHARFPRITPDEYTTGRDTGLALFLAGTKTTKENGATRFVPGSHLGASGERPSEENVHYGEMEPGDAMIMFTSMHHAGSANTSYENRLVYTTFSCQGILRQFENQYLAIPPEEAAKWDDETLRVLGYTECAPFLGGVDFMDPMIAIRGQKTGKRMDMTHLDILSNKDVTE
ncbi:hypothetical protein MMC26_000386 [Xylographa opegraphella]|nr:hypothetical protein [Xylographa opegraphella]